LDPNYFFLNLSIIGVACTFSMPRRAFAHFAAFLAIDSINSAAGHCCTAEAMGLVFAQIPASW
jgi:hypothetical protein